LFTTKTPPMGEVFNWWSGLCHVILN